LSRRGGVPDVALPGNAFGVLRRWVGREGLVA